MRTDSYLSILALLILAGCATEPSTVTTTTTTQEVTTTSPVREVVVTWPPPSLRVETQSVAPDRATSGQPVTGDGPEPPTCGCRAPGWSAHGQAQFGWKATGYLVTMAGYGSQGTGNSRSQLTEHGLRLIRADIRQLITVRRTLRSPAQNLGENQRRNDRGIGFDDESRGIDAEFSPRDFLVGDRTGV